MPDEIHLNAQEHKQQFNDQIYRISAENYPLIFRRHLQSDEDLNKEYTPISKGKTGRIQREHDEKELDRLRKQTGNQHIGLYGMRYVNGATEQRRIREYYWKHATSKPDAELTKPDKELAVFMKDDENAFRSNVELLKAFESGEQERIRPYLEEMMTMILTEDMAWGMLNEHWLADNAGEFHEKLERFRVFTRLYNENAWFKDSLPDDIKSLVENKLEEAVLLRAGLKLSLERQGIDPETLTIKRDFHYKGNKSVRSKEEIDSLLDAKKKEFKKTLNTDFKITKSIRKLTEEEQTRAKEEAARTEAPENAEYKKAKRLIKDVPEEMQKDFEDALFTMAKDIGDYKIVPNTFGHFDTVTAELKNASREYYLLRNRIKKGDAKTVSLEEQVNSLLRLSAAAHAFRHVNGAEYGKKAKDRKSCAGTLIINTRLLIDKCIADEGAGEAVVPLDHLKIAADKGAKKKVSEATEQLKKLHRAWRGWRTALSKNTLDTPEERLMRYKTLFDDYREPLQLWVSNKELFAKYGNKGENEFAERAVDEYTRVMHELTFIEWARKRGRADQIQKSEVDETIDRELSRVDGIKEAAPIDMSVDNKLNEKQKQALLEVDQWILRNMTGDDQSEMISKLLRKTKCERLYIYYLIETRARVKPTADDIPESQNRYYPDVRAFKDQMVKSRFKFMSRLSKNTIYWDKIRQAMDICDGNRSLIRELYEPKDLNRADIKAEAGTARKLRAVKTRMAIDEYKRIMSECHGDKNVIQSRKNEIEAAITALKDSFNEMLTAEMEEKANTGSMAESAWTEGSGGLEKTIGLNIAGLLKSVESLGAVGAAAGGVFVIADGMFSLVDTATDLFMQWPDISGSEILSKLSDVVSSTATVFGTGWKNVDNTINIVENVAKEFAEINAAELANKTTVVTSGVTAVAGLAQLAVSANRATHASSARAYLKQKYESGQANENVREKKFDTQLQKLNDKIRQGKALSGTAKVVSGVLGVASVMIPPLAAVLGGAATVSQIAISAWGDSKIGDAELGLIDGFVEFEKMFPIILAERRGWKKVENTVTGRSLYRDQTGQFHEERELLEFNDIEKVKKSLQKRIAKKYNFNSYTAMITMVAKKYARFIHNKLFESQGEDTSYYKELLKSFGLTYKARTAKNPGKPSVDQIAKKLMGK
ncbi:hypothetical protein SAMN02910292_01554 [Lachnospiraceae bacterium XBB2008]|nr:hypothetical protein SAMN02910292_01554 [Lachnospiraceae bacterium XBB2008]